MVTVIKDKNMRRSRGQLGPGIGGEPFIDRVRFVDGSLTVGLRRELAQDPRQVHLIVLWDGGNEFAIHETLVFETDTKSLTAQFEPTVDDGTLAFDPVVTVGASSSETAAPSTERLPESLQLGFRIVGVQNTRKEYDTVTVNLTTDGGELSVTDLCDGLPGTYR